ncbi:hypothetical protein O6H91_13G081300 [Diphasiastrum complanatum]|uniref:Uncharacterized protein n=1 Tax=Diphasiastrum complanatum TaxID=34168 RepID=A0ACC2BWI7_DIPCM|nr:hypothetical protein O6H91_Y572900 [Diphasiastrum complanatum]KAJ7534133.1 hypothetical protein O6H91_13G081300 [Diphasiastrum complanatum]
MFYSQFILAKKGPLGTIWIAAHLERKLRRNQVTETNIGMSVDSILFPEVPIALRLSGHLLLGVVRIYSRKVNYLFHDCSEALVKIKQAFHSGVVDLPPEAATAPFHSITLPETFDLDEFELLPERESSLLAKSSVDHHVTSREQITLQDPLEDSVYLDSQFGLDERFADSDAARMGLDFDEDLLFGKSGNLVPSPAPTPPFEDVIPSTPADNVLDLQTMPATPADDALDFQPMDCDDQHEPSTPAIALDLMDLHEHHEPSTSVVGVDQMELEDRIESSTAVQTLESDQLGFTEHENMPREPENLETLKSTLSPVQLEEENLDSLTTMEPPKTEMLTSGEENMDTLKTMEPPKRELLTSEEENLDSLAKVEPPPREVLTSGEENLDSLTTMELPQREVLTSGEKNLDSLTPMELPQRGVLMSEGENASLTAMELPKREVLTSQNAHKHEGLKSDEVSEAEKVICFKKQLSSERMHLCEESLEIEKVRSAAEVTEQELDAFSGVRDRSFEEDYTQDKVARGDAEIREDRREEGSYKATEDAEIPRVEKVQLIAETPMRAGNFSFTPRPSPFSAPSSMQLPADNDVLATILGRSTPAIHVAPTPSETPARKRHKPGPKPSTRKRKPICDVSMVLHGEVMRQQQANTNDIRRIRKKAPCTMHEIWAMQKDAHGQQIFCEPSFLGLNEEIRELYHRVFGVGGAKISPASCIENSPHNDIVHEVSVGAEVSAATTIALPKLVEAESHDSEAVHSKAMENEQEQKEAFSVRDPLCSEAAISTCPVALLESSGMGPALASTPVIEAETVQTMDVEQQIMDVGQQVQGQIEGKPRIGEEDLRAEVDTSCESTKVVEVVQEAVHRLENDLICSSETLSTGEPTTLVPESQNVGSETENFFVEMVDEESRKETLISVHEADKEIQTSEQDSDEDTQKPVQETNKETELPIPDASTECTLPAQETSEDTQVQEESQMEIKIDVQEASTESRIPVQEVDRETELPIQLKDKESQRGFDKDIQVPIQGAHEQSQLPQEAEKENHTSVLQVEPSALLQPKDEASGEVLDFPEDTNYTDADVFYYDEGDDFDEEPEYDPDMTVQDNSGWSVRTRAVSQYLRATFQALETNSKNLEEVGPPKLGLEQLLVGKNRKEAARMFFETLVLKTKDYIHVQQAGPFDDIEISARAKLMKAEI